MEQFYSRRVGADSVELLKEERKSSVYRIGGVGENHSALIAKRSLRRYAHIEQVIYEEILPHLPISKLIFHGCVSELDTDYVWLFLEDGGTEEFIFSIQDHRRLAARWLAQLHASALRVPAVSRLPDRGPSYYQSHLSRARELIQRNVDNHPFEKQDIRILEDILLQCDSVESHWSEIEELCSRFPRTLVHGDFSKQNLRIRSTTSGIKLVVFDWEKSGCGIVAPDIAELSGRGVIHQQLNSASPNKNLAEYLAVVGDTWPNLDLLAIDKLADVGAVFRLLAAISWESEDLEYGRFAIEGLHSFQLKLAVSLNCLGFG